MTTDIKPNQTIYIKNLNEKIKKEGMSLMDGCCNTIHTCFL